MAKELPYFRFTVAEWLNDDISLESYELKGFFIDLCAFYWFRDCEVTKKIAEKKFSNAKGLLDELIELDIIKYNPTKDLLEINFLKKQFKSLGSLSKKRSEAGRSGGLKKASNARNLPKQNPSYKDNNKDNNKDNKRVQGFLSLFNSMMKKEYDTMPDQGIQDLMSRIDNDGANKQTFKKVIASAKLDPYHIDTNFLNLTPAYVCRDEAYQKYLHFKINKQ